MAARARWLYRIPQDRLAANMALQRTRRPRIRSGRALRSLGSPLNARSLDAAENCGAPHASGVLLRHVGAVSGAPLPAGLLPRRPDVQLLQRSVGRAATSPR